MTESFRGDLLREDFSPLAREFFKSKASFLRGLLSPLCVAFCDLLPTECFLVLDDFLEVDFGDSTVVSITRDGKVGPLGSLGCSFSSFLMFERHFHFSPKRYV